MSQLLSAWEAYLRHERLASPRTVVRYRRVLTEFERFLADEHDDGLFALDAIDTNTLKRFLRRTAEGRDDPSRASFNLRLSALSSFYNHLVHDEKIRVNPAAGIRRVKVTRREVHPLSFDQMLAFLDALRSGPKPYRSRNVAMAQVLLHTGLRVAELVSLDVDQVDLDAHAFRAVRTKGDNHLAIEFNDVVAEALEVYLDDRPTLAKGSPKGPLFLSNRGTRISVRTVQDMVKRYAEKAGIDQAVTPHLFRHSLATGLADMGVHITVIQEVLGHASIETTRHYTHVAAKQRRRAVNAYADRWRRRARRKGKEASGE